MKTVKIALRYCGGCNPRYRRSTLAAQLQEAVPEVELEVYSGPEEGYQGVLVVCGCTACCADQSDLPEDLPRFVLSGADCYEQAAGFLRGLNKEI